MGKPKGQVDPSASYAIPSLQNKRKSLVKKSIVKEKCENTTDYQLYFCI